MYALAVEFCGCFDEGGDGGSDWTGGMIACIAGLRKSCEIRSEQERQRCGEQDCLKIHLRICRQEWPNARAFHLDTARWPEWQKFSGFQASKTEGESGFARVGKMGV